MPRDGFVEIHFPGAEAENGEPDALHEAARPMTPISLPFMNVLGAKVTITNLSQVVELLTEELGTDGPNRYICVVDVHCIMQSYRRREVRATYNSADLCVPDGMPLTWVGRYRGYPEIGRVYGPDLMLKMMDISAEKGFTNFFCGGAEGVADDLAEVMAGRFPGLSVVGTYCPPFRPMSEEEKYEMVEAVNSVRPDLLWVGLGAPKQDLFMAEFHQRLATRIMIGVGAAFDFHTGRVRQAPRWMMRHGFEWLFRLVVEPRRLGPRYLRNNPAFIWNILLQETGLRDYPLD